MATHGAQESALRARASFTVRGRAGQDLGGRQGAEPLPCDHGAAPQHGRVRSPEFAPRCPGGLEGGTAAWSNATVASPPSFPGCGWINVPTPESRRYSFQGDRPLPKLSGPQHESPHQHNRDTPAAQAVPGDGTAGQEPRTGAGVLHRPAVPGRPSRPPQVGASSRSPSESLVCRPVRASSEPVRAPPPPRPQDILRRPRSRASCAPTRSRDPSPEPPPRRRLLPAAGPRTRGAFVPHGLLATRPVPTARAQGLVFLSNAHISVG